MKSKPIPVTLIAGYLGSGKTTLVNHILNHSENQRIAILVNDFGDLAIDVNLIQAENDAIISLKGGCICCSYSGGLLSALQKVSQLEPTPEQILIETSGVAVPSSIVLSIKLMPLLQVNCTVVLVDAEMLLQQVNDRYIGSTVNDQLACADLVLLNKIDLMVKEEQHDVVHWLNSQFPEAKLIETSYSNLSPLLLFEWEQTEGSWSTRASQDDLSNKVTIEGDHTHQSVFTTFVLAISPLNQSSALVEFLSSSESRIVRAKGYLKTTDDIQLIQIVANRAQVEELSYVRESSVLGNVVCIAVRDKFNIEAFKRQMDCLDVEYHIG